MYKNKRKISRFSLKLTFAVLIRILIIKHFKLNSIKIRSFVKSVKHTLTAIFRIKLHQLPVVKSEEGNQF